MSELRGRLRELEELEALSGWKYTQKNLRSRARLMKDDITSKPLVGEHKEMATFNQGTALGLALAADCVRHEMEQIEIDISSRVERIRQEQEQEMQDE